MNVRRFVSRGLLGLGVAAGALGCRSEAAQAAEVGPVLASQRVPASGALAASQTASNPLTAASNAQPDERKFEGRVAERKVAGSYTYLAIATDDAGPRRWVATMGTGFEPGARVRIDGFAASDDFFSARLGRRFDRLVFGTATALTSD